MDIIIEKKERERERERERELLADNFLQLTSFKYVFVYQCLPKLLPLSVLLLYEF